MKISKQLSESIVKTVLPLIQNGETEGVLHGYELKFYVDKRPKDTLLEFPLSLLIEGKEGTLYIGGQAN